MNFPGRPWAEQVIVRAIDIDTDELSKYNWQEILKEEMGSILRQSLNTSRSVRQRESTEKSSLLESVKDDHFSEPGDCCAVPSAK